MDLKFTLRDIFAYFLTGVSSVVFATPLEYEKILAFITAVKAGRDESYPLLGLLQNNATLLFVTIVACFYLLGHIVQSVDVARYELIKKYLQPHDFKRTWWSKIYIAIMGGRVTSVLFQRCQEQILNSASEKSDQEQNLVKGFEGPFWKKTAYLQVKDKYSYSDYWYVIKDLLNGLETVSLLLFGYTLIFRCIIPWSTDWIRLGILYLVLAVLFRLKAKVYASAYVRSVESIYDFLRQ